MRQGGITTIETFPGIKYNGNGRNGGGDGARYVQEVCVWIISNVHWIATIEAVLLD